MSSSQVQQRGQEWLEKFLKLSGLEVQVEAIASPSEHDDSCWLAIDSATLTPQQVQTLIGEKGLVLDSIQYLANTTLNLGAAEDQRQAYTIELGGYRMQRLEELQAIAQDAAQRAQETREEVELTALSSAERRQVHTILKDVPQLETFSRGQEPDRRLVIRMRDEG
jgi:spoIIIJ-associated protein